MWERTFRFALFYNRTPYSRKASLDMPTDRMSAPTSGGCRHGRPWAHCPHGKLRGSKCRAGTLVPAVQVFHTPTLTPTLSLEGRGGSGTPLPNPSASRSHEERGLSNPPPRPSPRGGRGTNTTAPLGCGGRTRSGDLWVMSPIKNGGPPRGRLTFRWLRGPDSNRRPLGYEPNELPNCSTPRQQKVG